MSDDKGHQSGHEEGHIPLCPHNNCAFRCCDYKQAGAIVLHPGELEQAIASHRSVGHLQIVNEDYYGGKKVLCKARDTSTCDNGYKPTDCLSYPFFPLPPRSHADTRIRLAMGEACPLAAASITAHSEYVQNLWKTLTGNSVIAEWLCNIWTDAEADLETYIDLLSGRRNDQ